VSETSAGGELTIDHYRPRAAGGGDEDDNLVYACVKCNQYKADFWPDELDIAAGRRILHPLLDDGTSKIAQINAD
jgi:5-methylcytosine-specific restriction endonuclease McrA